MFSFVLNNNIYADGDKVYLCPNSLPDTIQVIDDSETAITFSTTWSGAQAISGNPSKAKIDLIHFTANYAHVRCSFVDGINVSHEIEVHIYNNVTAMFGGRDKRYRNDADEEQLTNDMNSFVYPNPAKDKLFVRYDFRTTVEHIEIYSSFGQPMHVVRISETDGPLNLDISKFPSGVYFLTITLNDGTRQSTSFVIND